VTLSAPVLQESVTSADFNYVRNSGSDVPGESAPSSAALVLKTYSKCSAVRSDEEGIAPQNDRKHQSQISLFGLTETYNWLLAITT